MKALWILPSVVLLISACSERPEDAYKRGYTAGYADATVKLKNASDRRIGDLEAAHRLQTERLQAQIPKPQATPATEFCGVDGVNLRGRHIDGGRSGCVRVYNDGRYEQY